MVWLRDTQEVAELYSHQCWVSSPKFLRGCSYIEWGHARLAEGWPGATVEQTLQGHTEPGERDAEHRRMGGQDRWVDPDIPQRLRQACVRTRDVGSGNQGGDVGRIPLTGKLATDKDEGEEVQIALGQTP
jgi:hypothetical protein